MKPSTEAEPAPLFRRAETDDKKGRVARIHPSCSEVSIPWIEAPGSADEEADTLSCMDVASSSESGSGHPSPWSLSMQLSAAS